MKKLISISIFVFVCSILSAQQIPNGSFLYWSSSFTPDGWGTWASAVGFLNGSTADSLSVLAVRDTAAGDYITDSATLRLTVDTVDLPTQGRVVMAGFASLGGAYYSAPPTGVGLQFGYMPYTSKPDTLYADFKYIPAVGHNDTALIFLSLTKFDTLSHSRFSLMSLSIPITAATQWQRNVAFPLASYYNSGLPDTLLPDSMQVVIYSSVSAVPSAGTTLWIDSLHFDASVTPVIIGIPDIALRSITIYPDPADDRLNVAVTEREVGSTLVLFNAMGQVVSESILERQLTSVATRHLPDGIYSLHVRNDAGVTVYKAPVVVLH